MRYHRPLSYIVDNPIKVDILRFLVRTGAEWNGREIAKELRISPAACHKALKSLYREGVVLLRATGNTHLYHLNLNHIITKNLLQPLFGWEIRGLKNLADLINHRLKKHASRYFASLALFGSIITGQAKPNSDIDLLVLIKRAGDKPKAEKLLDKLGTVLVQHTGNMLSPYIQTIKEFKQKYKRRLPVIKNIVKSHHLVWGKPIKNWL